MAQKMAAVEIKDETTPLLHLSRSRVGTASVARTLGNIVVSIVGTGVLGLPYTFKISGWALGSIAVTMSAILTFYCMLLLVRSRNRLEEEAGQGSVLTYGDVGRQTYGQIGQALVDVLVLVSQSGCCVAYLIFIGQNLSSIFTGGTEKQPLFIALLLPLEIMLGWVRSLAGLAPSSILADVCNVLAMGIVVKDDFNSFEGFDGSIAFRNWTTFPFAFGVAVYCYEGFGMTLTLEASMRKKHLFPRVLAQALLPITLLYIAFGLVGYFAFRDETRDIITLNLPNDWSTVVVKLGLCVALVFTFPVMMYPVHELVETKLTRSSFYQRLVGRRPKLSRFILDCMRGVLVLAIAVVAVLIPTFGVFISIVGSTVCAMLSFVFPAAFHLHAYKDCISIWQKVIDWLLIVGGVSFAVYGTYTTCVGFSV